MASPGSGVGGVGGGSGPPAGQAVMRLTAEAARTGAFRTPHPPFIPWREAGARVRDGGGEADDSAPQKPVTKPAAVHGGPSCTADEGHGGVGAAAGAAAPPPESGVVATTGAAAATGDDATLADASSGDDAAAVLAAGDEREVSAVRSSRGGSRSGAHGDGDGVDAGPEYGRDGVPWEAGGRSDSAARVDVVRGESPDLDAAYTGQAGLDAAYFGPAGLQADDPERDDDELALF
jgi:hypothetical protein